MSTELTKREEFGIENIGIDLSGSFVPYLGFIAKSGDVGPEVRAQNKGMKTGDPFICLGESDEDPDKKVYIDARKVEIQILREAEFFVERDEAGSITAVSKDRSSGYRKEVVTVALCYLPQGLIGTVTKFAGAKENFVKTHLQQVVKSQRGAWAKKSEAHGAAAGSFGPRLRVVSGIRMTKEPIKSGPRAGQLYDKATALPKPIDPGKADLLNAFLEAGEDAALYDRFNFVVKDLESQILEDA